MDQLSGRTTQAGHGREFLRTPLGSMLGSMLVRGGPGWELNTSVRVQAALITHVRQGEAAFISACAASPNLSSAAQDALRVAFTPWIMKASQQDLRDAVSNSSLPGTKILIDWDKMPGMFTKKSIMLDKQVRDFWVKKREAPDS